MIFIFVYYITVGHVLYFKKMLFGLKYNITHDIFAAYRSEL
jgi:hypothetical protein